MGVFSTLHAESLLRARDKMTCLQILASNGVAVPKTAISNNPFTIGQMLDTVGDSPHIIKLANGTQGIGVILAENRTNAESILETFNKLEQRVLVQKFVKEAKGCDVRVFIVNKEIVGVMKRIAKAGEFRSNVHRGATSIVVKLTSQEEETALKAADLMGLSVAGVDMLQSDLGPLILEVNASPGLEGIEGTTQVDIAGKIIEYIERNA
jgi:ribosomal protein S6--L-glutamate ligase